MEFQFPTVIENINQKCIQSLNLVNVVPDQYSWLCKVVVVRPQDGMTSKELLWVLSSAYCQLGKSSLFKI